LIFDLYHPLVKEGEMSQVFMMDLPRFGDPPPSFSRKKDADSDLSPYEQYKAQLGRAYLNANQPANYDLLPVQTTTEQLAPASANWAKGAGATLSPQEIVYIRELARQEFLQRQRLAWQSRTNHL
jgi:hypothetical protein